MYNIRQANFSDIGFFLDMAQKEGWEPGLYDAKSFFAADKNGFFIGEIDNKPVSCISAIKYNNYGFIGFYVVKEEFRGQGLGLQIWQHALNYLGDINIGLDGVVAQVENYKKFRFKLAHSNARYMEKFQQADFIDENIIEANAINFEKLHEYDRQHFEASRKEFLKEWITQSESFAYCYMKNTEINGFGVCRKIKDGFKIGPLFADDIDTAEKILLKLVSKTNNLKVYLDINEELPSAVELVNKYNMTKVFETRRMYTKSQPIAKWDEVFGITSFELG